MQVWSGNDPRVTRPARGTYGSKPVLIVPGAQAGRSGLGGWILGDGARRTGAQSFLDAHDLGVKVVCPMAFCLHGCDDLTPACSQLLLRL